LLTLSSIFLCGIVVTYVGNADNYRQKYKGINQQTDALKENVKSLTKQLNEKTDKSQQRQDRLNSEIVSLKAEIKQLQGDLGNVEVERAALLQKVNSWTSIVKDFRETNEDQGRLLEEKLNELNKVQAEQIKQRKELRETTAALVEKMAYIETLEVEKRRLLEEKSELRGRLDQLLRPFGKTTARLVPVTPEKAAVKPAKVIARDIDLRGLVAAVDLKNSIASISIGAADGVKEGMRFHVTRGDEFICNILIIDVDTEKAVGVLELLRRQQQPRVGDKVSTNL